MQITITRSEEWVAAQRLATGRNVPKQVDGEIDTARLSEVARAVLLQQGGGKYPDALGCLSIDKSFQINRHANYGRYEFILDVDVEDYKDRPDELIKLVDGAIIAAANHIEAGGGAAEKEQVLRAEKKQAEKGAKAAHDQRVEAATELLADVLADLRMRLDQANGNRDDERERVKVLSHFLRAVPLDALRGAARRLAEAQTEDGEAAIAKGIDDAATCYIFDRDDVDDEDPDDF